VFKRGNSSKLPDNADDAENWLETTLATVKQADSSQIFDSLVLK